MKRIVLDQGLAPRTAEILRADGWDAIHVIEAGLERAEDAAILDFARASDRTCVTLDHDFHAHLALAGSGRPSVVLIRVEKLGPDEQARLIQKVWHVCEERIAEGAAVSVHHTSIRVRKLPLG